MDGARWPPDTLEFPNTFVSKFNSMASFSIASIIFVASIFLAFRVVRYMAGRHQTVDIEETPAMVEEKTEAAAPYMPPYIIEEILARLPVTSVLKFRSVNEDWRQLLTDSAFIKKHLKYATENDETYGFLLQLRSYTFFNEQLFRFIPFSTFDEEKTVMLDNPEMEGSSLMALVGSANGLLCLSENTEVCDAYMIFLLNPATREYKKLPNFSHERLLGFDVSLGFGFDLHIEDYRVVKIIFDGYSCSEVQQYSLRTDSWRTPTFVPYRIVDNCSKAIVNGSLHWLAENGRMDDRVSTFIIFFNMADELFGKIVLPDSISGDMLFLRAFRGRLHIIHNKYVNSSIQHILDIWVMEEYGAEQSWIRLFTAVVPEGFFRPLEFWKNGKLILEKLSGEMVSYDPAIHRIEFFQHGSDNQELFPYVQSLVSLPKLRNERIQSGM